MIWKAGQLAYHEPTQTLFKICMAIQSCRGKREIALFADPNGEQYIFEANQCHIALREHLQQAKWLVFEGKRGKLEPQPWGVIFTAGDRRIGIQLTFEPDEVELAAISLAQTFNGAIVKGEIDLTQFGIEEEEDDADF